MTPGRRLAGRGSPAATGGVLDQVRQLPEWIGAAKREPDGMRGARDARRGT